MVTLHSLPSLMSESLCGGAGLIPVQHLVCDTEITALLRWWCEMVFSKAKMVNAYASLVDLSVVVGWSDLPDLFLIDSVDHLYAFYASVASEIFQKTFDQILFTKKLFGRKFVRWKTKIWP